MLFICSICKFGTFVIAVICGRKGRRWRAIEKLTVLKMSKKTSPIGAKKHIFQWIELNKAAVSHNEGFSCNKQRLDHLSGGGSGLSGALLEPFLLLLPPDDLAYEVRWYFTRLRGGETTAQVASMDRFGLVRTEARNSSSDISLERKDTNAYVLSVHGTQDR